MTLPLTATSPIYHHVLQSLSLVALALFLHPVNTIFAILCNMMNILNSIAHRHGFSLYHSPDLCRPTPTLQRTILITGLGMAKGLHIARAFFQRGHVVIGADVEPWSIPVSGRFSRALRKFQRLPSPDSGCGAKEVYIAAIVDLVRREGIELWVSCSGVASAIEDAEAAKYVERVTGCRVFQFDVDLTRKLHEKNLFVDQARMLGMNVPETHTVTNITQAMDLLYPHENKLPGEMRNGKSTDTLSAAGLHQKNILGTEVIDETTQRHDNYSAKKLEHDGPLGGKRSYLMKSILLDDTVRSNMVLFPRSTMQKTYAYISNLRPTPTRPFVLQQFIAGPEYTTHSIVIRGRVVAFTACASKDLLMHYKALDPSTPISRALETYTSLFASRIGDSMTGHLSIDFLLDDEGRSGEDTDEDLMTRLYPIECNPRAHTAVVLFQENSLAMADAYLSILDDSDLDSRDIVRPRGSFTYFWVGNDMVTKIILPLLKWLIGRVGWDVMIEEWKQFADLILMGKEGTWCIWDPWPAWCLYSVYWPAMLVCMVLSLNWWSRCNVSTGKIFRC